MNLTSKNWYRTYLCCPDCREDLAESDGKLSCTNCDYDCIDSGEASAPLDIKPNNPATLHTQLPRIIKTDIDQALNELDLTKPAITYDGPTAIRDSRELMSQMSHYLKDSGKVFDLGCGPRDQADPIEYLGHQYVGADYSNPAADMLADAHAIPFKDETFDCVFSYAVLEHLHNPFIGIAEIERVLKPGGIYVGTVSQGEPFHASYFHHTSWGLISLISSISNLEIKKIWSAQDTLGSLSVMGRYPRVIKSLLGLIDKLHIAVPQLAPRKRKWPQKEQDLDKLHRAGGICFVIQKPK